MQLDIGLGAIQLPERSANLDHSCVQRVVFPSSLRDLALPCTLRVSLEFKRSPNCISIYHQRDVNEGVRVTRETSSCRGFSE